jgi:hypothetical protein
MRFFTIHERPGKTGGDADLLAVKTGFSWWAAVLPPLWLLRHRLWLGFVLYMLFSTVFGLALEFADIADPAATALGLALSVLIGVSAHDFRRWTLARHGWRMAGVLRADTADDAESLFHRSGRTAVTPVQTLPVAATMTRPMPPISSGNAEAFPRLFS